MKLNEDLRKDIAKKIRKTSQTNGFLHANSLDPPALELDVYISKNKMEKLIVYKDDSPERVAEEFSMKYFLNDEKKKLLLQVIKEQVSKVLT